MTKAQPKDGEGAEALLPWTKPTALQRAVIRLRAESRMRDRYPCNYPACGCDWDAVCDDAIPATPAGDHS